MEKTQFERIQHMTGKTPVECSCDTCKAMCRHTSCLGTPDDIEKIMLAGHSDKLEIMYWAAGLEAGIPLVKIIMPRMNENGCAFLDENGLCSLHKSGLKPTEGKLATCATSPPIPMDKVFEPGHMPIAYAVVLTWIKQP